MAAMRVAGHGHQPPAHATVRESTREYLVELDVSDFAESELSVEATGPRLTIRGDQLELTEDKGKAFRLHERLEESFRLPDDADTDRIKAYFRHGMLEIHAPRRRFVPRPVPIEHKPHLVNPGAEAS